MRQIRNSCHLTEKSGKDARGNRDWVEKPEAWLSIPERLLSNIRRFFKMNIHVTGKSEWMPC